MSKKFSKPEIVAYHKVKHIFLSLAEIKDEDPDLTEIFKFKGKDFNLTSNIFLGTCHFDGVFVIRGCCTNISQWDEYSRSS